MTRAKASISVPASTTLRGHRRGQGAALASKVGNEAWTRESGPYVLSAAQTPKSYAKGTVTAIVAPCDQRVVSATERLQRIPPGGWAA